jgi:hypothetical protein
MAKKKPEKSSSLLKVDWDKVLSKSDPASPLAQKLEHVDNPVFSQGGNAQQPMKPANHKSHIRQKKV